MNKKKEAPEKERLSEDYFADFDFSKAAVSLEEMFKSGVHFGHHKSRKNPKMDEYIFGVKNSINIIDLQKTAEKIDEACRFITELVASGQEILFVGTKKQAKKLVKSAAIRCESPYVTERWLGGTFTNFSVISARARYLNESEDRMKRGDFAKYTKFEQMKISEELEKLERKIGGIRHMSKLPGSIFITGVIEDVLALKEAGMKNIPVVAICDTNVDPGGVDYPIPANEDAVSSLRLILTYIARAVLEGKNKRKKEADNKDN